MPLLRLLFQSPQLSRVETADEAYPDDVAEPFQSPQLSRVETLVVDEDTLRYGDFNPLNSRGLRQQSTYALTNLKIFQSPQLSRVETAFISLPLVSLLEFQSPQLSRVETDMP